MSVTSTLEKDRKLLTISITGNFDFSAHADFRKAYIDADPSLGVAVNLSQTEYIDSAALGMLLLLDEHFPNSTVQLKSASEFVKKVLEIANFDKKFTIT